MRATDREGDLVHQRDHFSMHVGDAFRVAGSPDVEWRLSEVSELRQSGAFESYSIEFETAQVGGAQGMVALEHAELGTVELFVVAVGPDRYEAVFNRLVSAPA